MDKVTQELHRAYLEGTEPKVADSSNRYGHYWGRAWQRGDIVKLKDGKKILITGNHPELTYKSLTFPNLFRYAMEESWKTFKSFFNHKPRTPRPGYHTMVSTDSVSIYTLTQPEPSLRISEDREVAS